MKENVPRPEKKRPINKGAKSAVGQARRNLYQKTLKRVKEANEAGFVLEAIALLESVISDRLEARLAWLGLECEGGGRFWPLAKMTETLIKQSNDPDDAQKAYANCAAWGKSRNKALHGLAKLAKVEEDHWDKKYSRAQRAADEGLKVFRELDKWVKKLNRRLPSK